MSTVCSYIRFIFVDNILLEMVANKFSKSNKAMPIGKSADLASTPILSENLWILPPTLVNVLIYPTE